MLGGLNLFVLLASSQRKRNGCVSLIVIKLIALLFLVDGTERVQAMRLPL